MCEEFNSTVSLENLRSQISRDQLSKMDSSKSNIL